MIKILSKDKTGVLEVYLSRLYVLPYILNWKQGVLGHSYRVRVL